MEPPPVVMSSMMARSPSLLLLDRGFPCLAKRCELLAAVITSGFPLLNDGCNVVSSLQDIPWSSPPQLLFVRLDSEQKPDWFKELVKSIKERWSNVPMFGICCAPQVGANDLIELMDDGLDDYVCCPWTDRDLIPRLRRGLNERKSEKITFGSEDRSSAFRHHALIGQSPRFLKKVNEIIILANSDATVLVTGETGTGKELFAQAIHFNSSRKSKPFIPVNCSALPDQLFENELFGHVRGAYTHASSTQLGLVQEAEGGTLFLDEVDTLTMPAQTKLLRFLQSGEYRPLGTPKSQKADVRIVAASNANIRDRIVTKEFREDLFYRLNVLTVCVPSLRERIDDIPLLVNYFLSRYEKTRGVVQPTLSPEAIDKLMRYSWPGNIRELEGVIQRAITFASGVCLLPEDIELPEQNMRPSTNGGMSVAKVKAMGEFERSYLVNLLALSQGNISRAAKTAGKERRTFQRLLRKYGLARQTFLHP
jgi:DNA-binding NtrC family response regulator